MKVKVGHYDDGNIQYEQYLNDNKQFIILF